MFIGNLLARRDAPVKDVSTFYFLPVTFYLVDPRPLLSADNPREGTLGPIVGTIVVIAILVVGAAIALQSIVDQVQSRRAAAAAASSSLPANVPYQTVTVEQPSK